MGVEAWLTFAFVGLSVFVVSSARAAELRNMTGAGAPVVAGGTNESLWTTFYDTLSQIRMYHAKFPNAARLTAANNAASSGTSVGGGANKAEGAADEPSVDDVLDAGHGVHFSAEECFGERVDMHALHERLVNLPHHFARTTDYLSFLALLPTFATSVPRERKIKAQPHEYRKFVQAVLDYLIAFQRRTSPLADIDTLRNMVRQEFEQMWNNRTLPGWFDEQPAAPAAAASSAAAAAPATAAPAAAAEQEPGAAAPAPAADGAASAAASSSANGPADASNPLYCVACAKLFAKDSVFAAHLTGKKHKKNEEIRAALQGGAASGATPAAASGATTDASADTNASAEGQPNNGASASKLSADLRSLALLEFEVSSFAGLLAPVLEQTRTFLLRKQTRTFDELAAELRATEEEVARAKAALSGKGIEGGAKDVQEEDEDEDAHATIYNPLNLPLGIDGKPIPLWLYKLHGLNLKFTCEICGDYSYAGPRNFERHFSEWRHAHGMRALGIPNTRHFAHITRMADAQALFEKLKREGAGAAGFRADEEQEFEDREGNVFNKRTFMELQRQGLV
jgi:splicing factor 3A subunit 3